MKILNENILDINFRKAKANPFEFDIFKIEDFFSRKLDHSIEKPHRINFFFLLFVIDGNGKHFIDFKETTYKKGDLLFVAEKQIHRFHIRKNTSGFIVIFTKEFLYETDFERSLLQNYRIFDYSLKSPIISSERADFHHFKNLFNQLFIEHNNNPIDRLKREITHSLLKTILLKAERLKQNQVQNPKTESLYKDFVNFREVLEQNFQNTRKVQDYSRILGTTTKKLNRITKANLNQTAKSFIDERVIIEIKRLLVHTDLSIKEISFLVGFDEPTNLVKYFKRHIKITPKQFRRNN